MIPTLSQHFAKCFVLKATIVTEAADGKEAQFRFDQQAPDLACLDVMMPGLSGFDLCRHFRKSHPRLPILFITAKSEEIDKVVGLELGADDYIVKTVWCQGSRRSRTSCCTTLHRWIRTKD